MVWHVILGFSVIYYTRTKQCTMLEEDGLHYKMSQELCGATANLVGFHSRGLITKYASVSEISLST